MMAKWDVVPAISVLALSLCLPTPLSAAAGRARALAEVETAADLVVFQPQIPYSQVRVTVTGPEGFEVVATFDADESAAVALPGADGLYKYELRFSPILDLEASELLAAAREAGVDLGSDKAADKRTVQRGWFSVAGGSVVPELLEPQPKVLLTAADGVIRNSLCVGFDCPNSPVFDDSTILMMENNTRIKFGDTSNAPFPNNDWEIEANSSLSGGPSYLGFNDCGTADNDGGCATDLVFAVEAGARQSALFVESDGDVGIGTSNPVLDLHIVTGNTPALRLDQDGSSGFTPQVWDVAGNETNFFVRDVTAGSRLPFRIRPGAATSSIDIAADSEVGIGTSAPGAKLHVLESGTAISAFDKTGLVVQNSAASSDFAIITTISGESANGQLNFGAPSNEFQGRIIYNTGTDFMALHTNGSEKMRIESDGDICVGTTSCDHDLEIVAGAACSEIDAGETGFTNCSSRFIKENLQPLRVENILEKIGTVDVYSYDFIGGPSDRIGLMAEDFHQVFGRGSDQKLSGHEIQLALWLAVQELNRKLVEEVTDLRAAVEALTAAQ